MVVVNAGAAVEVIVGGRTGNPRLHGYGRTVPMAMLNSRATDIAPCRFKSLTQAMDWNVLLGSGRNTTIYEAIYPETVAWSRNCQDLNRLPTSHPDLDRLLSEMSRSTAS